MKPGRMSNTDHRAARMPLAIFAIVLVSGTVDIGEHGVGLARADFNMNAAMALAEHAAQTGPPANTPPAYASTANRLKANGLTATAVAARESSEPQSDRVGMRLPTTNADATSASPRPNSGANRGMTLPPGPGGTATLGAPTAINAETSTRKSMTRRVRRLPSTSVGNAPVQAVDPIRGSVPGTRPQSATSRMAASRPPAAGVRATPAAYRVLPTEAGRRHADRASEAIAQAETLLRVGAHASAEQQAWTGIEMAARAVATTSGPGSNNPSLMLEMAREAIDDARALERLRGLNDSVIAHRVRLQPTAKRLMARNIAVASANASGLDWWIDAYLDEARRLMAGLAARSVSAAHGMDLLAAIMLQRDDPRQLPSRVAICFRRAALQGQPENASLAKQLGLHLADVGLTAEAQVVLQHAYGTGGDPEVASALIAVSEELVGRSSMRDRRMSVAKAAETPKVRLEQLTPAQFASASRDVIGRNALGSSARSDASAASYSASTRMNSVPMSAGTNARVASKIHATQFTPVRPTARTLPPTVPMQIVPPQAVDATPAQVQEGGWSGWKLWTRPRSNGEASR